MNVLYINAEAPLSALLFLLMLNTSGLAGALQFQAMLNNAQSNAQSTQVYKELIPESSLLLLGIGAESGMLYGGSPPMHSRICPPSLSLPSCQGSPGIEQDPITPQLFPPESKLVLVSDKPDGMPFRLWADGSSEDTISLLAEREEDWYQDDIWLQHDGMVLLQVRNAGELLTSLIKATASHIEITGIPASRQPEQPFLKASPEWSSWRFRTVYRNADGELVVRYCLGRSSFYEIPLREEKIQQSLSFIAWVSAHLLDELPRFTLGWNMPGAIFIPTQTVKTQTKDEELMDMEGAVKSQTQTQAREFVPDDRSGKGRSPTKTSQTDSNGDEAGSATKKESPSSRLQASGRPEEHNLMGISVLCKQTGATDTVQALIEQGAMDPQGQYNGFSFLEIAAESGSLVAITLIRKGARLLSTASSQNIHPQPIIYFLDETWDSKAESVGYVFRALVRQVKEDNVYLNEWLTQEFYGSTHEHYILENYSEKALKKLKLSWPASHLERKEKVTEPQADASAMTEIPADSLWKHVAEGEYSETKNILQKIPTVFEQRLTPQAIDSVLDACKRGYSIIMETLLEYGCSVNLASEATGTTLLMAAAEKNQKTVLETLFKYTPDIWAQNRQGDTAKDLLLNTLKMNEQDYCPSLTVLIEYEKGARQCLDACLYETSDSNLLNLRERIDALKTSLPPQQCILVPLLVRCKNDQDAMPMLQAWLESKYGAQIVDQQDADGKTPLMVAAQKNFVRCISELVKCRAVLECKDNQGFTALTYACLEGKMPAVTTLLDSGANRDTKDNSGRNITTIIGNSPWRQRVEKLFLPVFVDTDAFNGLLAQYLVQCEAKRKTASSAESAAGLSHNKKQKEKEKEKEKDSAKDSALQEQLRKAWKRVAELETRVHDLALQVTREPSKEDISYYDLERLRQAYLIALESKHDAQKLAVEAKQTAQKLSAENFKLKEDLSRERHYNELQRKSLLRELERLIPLEKKNNPMFDAKRGVFENFQQAQFQSKPPSIRLFLPLNMPERALKWGVSQWLELPSSESERKHRYQLKRKWHKGQPLVPNLKLIPTEHSLYSPVIEQMVHYNLEQRRVRKVSDYLALIQTGQTEARDLYQRLIKITLDRHQDTPLADKHAAVQKNVNKLMLGEMLKTVTGQGRISTDQPIHNVHQLKARFFAEYSDIHQFISPGIEQTLANSWFIRPLQIAVESSGDTPLTEKSIQELLPTLVYGSPLTNPEQYNTLLLGVAKDLKGKNQHSHDDIDSSHYDWEPDFSSILHNWLYQAVQLIRQVKITLSPGEYLPGQDYEELTATEEQRKIQKLLINIIFPSIPRAANSQIMMIVGDAQHLSENPLSETPSRTRIQYDQWFSLITSDSHEIDLYLVGDSLQNSDVLTEGKRILDQLKGTSTDFRELTKGLTFTALMDFFALNEDTARQVQARLHKMPLNMLDSWEAASSPSDITRELFIHFLGGAFEKAYKINSHDPRYTPQIMFDIGHPLGKVYEDLASTCPIRTDDVLSWLKEKHYKWYLLTKEEEKFTTWSTRLEAWLEHSSIPAVSTLKNEPVRRLLNDLRIRVNPHSASVQRGNIQTPIAKLASDLLREQPNPYGLVEELHRQTGYIEGDNLEALNKYIKSKMQFFKQIRLSAEKVRAILDGHHFLKELETKPGSR